MRSRLVPAMLAAGLLAIPACGSDAVERVALDSDGRRAETPGATDDTAVDEPGTPGGGGGTPTSIDMGAFGDCVNIGMAYAGLALAALGGENDAKRAQQKIEELKPQLPPELADDLDVVAKAYGDVAKKGILGGSNALDTPEYRDADANINAYLQKTCGGGG